MASERLAIESITFSNFKALVNTTLPLGPLTLIVGPNGSGKSTVLQAISFLQQRHCQQTETSWLRSATAPVGDIGLPRLIVQWKGTPVPGSIQSFYSVNSSISLQHGKPGEAYPQESPRIDAFLSGMRVFSLDPTRIEQKVNLAPSMELEATGAGLAGVLDRLRDDASERFTALNFELARWLPEFDQVSFDTPSNGHRQIKLRTHIGGHMIPASQLSQGTLLALTMLTMAHLPNPPSLIGLEEPDRGIHPRLLRDVRDALYRLAFPESFGESRPPVQVIATTQNPYFLDLFREHPEEVVVAEKVGLEATFTSLSAHPHIQEILADAPLGEVWYSGVLGGVPVSA